MVDLEDLRAQHLTGDQGIGVQCGWELWVMLTAGAGRGGVARCWHSFLELSLDCFFSICIVTSNWSYEFDCGASLSHLFSLFSFLLSLCDVKP